MQLYLRPNDLVSSFSTSAILLTLMPIIRHGRLAMLDGFQLSLIAFFWLLLLSLDGTRLDRMRSCFAGLACSFMLLLKAPLLLPAMVAAFIPMFCGKEFY